ncbi:protein phosphatase 2C domain-containing protein [bacterium]|nr:protein phosphatase 2C domain-containing protein [bacterium]
MWKVINASVVGTSHNSSATPCQDYSLVDTIIDDNNKEYLICLVADGAGSAANSAEGSELACVTTMTKIEQTLKASVPLSNNAVVDWIKTVQSTIHDVAALNNLTERDYACTLLGAVIGSDISIFFQVGDGAIIVSNNNVQGVVFWPDQGAYANMTYFVTGVDALQHLNVSIIDNRIDEISLLSDGLQRLALHFNKKIPHAPFFDPMLAVLRQQQAGKKKHLNSQLASFLDSPQVNERTDDDKTLVLATRINI